MKKRVLTAFLAAAMTFSLAACGSGSGDSSSQEQNGSVDDMTFDEMVEAAEGTTVTFYGWGGDEKLNDWLDNKFAPVMKEKYDITMERVPMDIDQVLSQLSGEIEGGEEDGSIDMIWINGENFATAKENGLLFGPFCQYLPNFNTYVDATSPEVTTDFGMDIDGYEAPYAKAQLVLICDSAVVPDPPTSAQALLAFCQANPGKFTYEAPPGFTGSAFVRNIIYEICGYETVAALDGDADKEEVRSVIAPAMVFLRQLNPYLWEGGRTFPATDAQADAMFMDGQLLLSMSYDPYHVSSMMGNGQYTDTCQAFVFDNGTIGNTNYVAIAGNSGNIPGALCLADAILSIPMQASKMEPTVWGALPVLDMDRLSEEELAVFSAIDTGAGSLSQEELLTHRLPELPAGLVPVIEEIWLEEVPGK